MKNSNHFNPSMKLLNSFTENGSITASSTSTLHTSLYLSHFLFLSAAECLSRLPLGTATEILLIVGFSLGICTKSFTPVFHYAFPGVRPYSRIN